MILNQDTAREFLTADDAANYRFFMTGTLITHIHKSLDGISEKIHEMRDTIKNKTAGMKELREELGLMAARLQQMASLESLQDKVNALKFEMACTLLLFPSCTLSKIRMKEWKSFSFCISS